MSIIAQPQIIFIPADRPDLVTFAEGMGLKNLGISRQTRNNITESWIKFSGARELTFLLYEILQKDRNAIL